MVRSRTRRGVLAAISASLAGGPAAAVGRSRRSAVAGGSRDPFDPAVHGFGFRNWSTAVPTFPEHDHAAVAEARVRRSVERSWRDPLGRADWLDIDVLPVPLLDLVARQVYVSVNQRSATNGHCYGMVFAAQRYYERPETVPLDRSVASEFGHPAEPLDAPAEPAGAAIDEFQNRQFLDFHAWVGRRMLLRPSWIDHRAQLSRLTAAVDEFGTAGITLLSTTTRALHQVLVHGYRHTSAGVALDVYEPNRAAADYAARDRAEWPRIDVDLRGDRPVVGPYGGQGYDTFVFNPLDRAVAARVDPGPPAGLDPANATGTADDRPARGLFPAALFLVDSPAVQVSVAGPAGRTVRRDVSPFLDRDRTEYHAMRYRYGAAPGRYRLALTGIADTGYSLDALVADADGSLLDESVSDAIAAGETHRYVARVPESAAGSGSLARTDDRWRCLGLAGAGVGVAGLAAGGYAAIRGRRRRKERAGESGGSGE